MTPERGSAPRLGTEGAQENRLPEAWSAEDNARSTPTQDEAGFKPVRRGSKQEAILRVLLERGDRGLNCFQAALQYGDFVLRSTISQLARHHGIQFRKEYETVPNRVGGTTDCVRYWLTDEGAAEARRQLGEVA